MKELLTFVRMLWPQRTWVFWGVTAGIVTLLAGTGLLVLSGWFLSAAAVAGLSLTASQNFNIHKPSAGIRTFALLRTVGRYVERVAAHEATLRLLATLRVWLYQRIEPQAPASLLRHRSGDLLNRIVTDIDILDTLFIRILSPTIAAVAVALTVGGVLWWLAPSLAVLFLLFFVAAGLLTPLLTERLGRRVGGEIQQQLALLRVNLIEDLQGAADLAVYGAEQRHRRKRLAENDCLLELQEKMAWISGGGVALTTLFSGMAALGALYAAQPMAQSGRFSDPVLALITFGVLAAFEAVLPLPLAYQMLGRVRTAAQRLLEVSDADQAVVFPTTPAPEPVKLSIGYRGVSFSYPGDPAEKAVAGIDLIVPENSTIALVGPSGCGKTTLAHLLTRFWDPEEGKITIGGEDIRCFSESQLRRLVTLVSQKSHIFSATLLDNLLIADPQAEEVALWDALEQAQLADFVTKLPEGLATWTGEAGAKLSGGEARRLILARSLLKSAPIWVLDEPTEGLDNLSRRRFTETLFANLTGKSALLITHTREALERVDQVCFLERGCIVACGSHSQLLKECPRYHHFIGSREEP